MRQRTPQSKKKASLFSKSDVAEPQTDWLLECVSPTTKQTLAKTRTTVAPKVRRLMVRALGARRVRRNFRSVRPLLSPGRRSSHVALIPCTRLHCLGLEEGEGGEPSNMEPVWHKKTPARAAGLGLPPQALHIKGGGLFGAETHPPPKNLEPKFS